MTLYCDFMTCKLETIRIPKKSCSLLAKDSLGLMLWYFALTADQRTLGASLGITEVTVSQYLRFSNEILAVQKKIPDCAIRYPSASKIEECAKSVQPEISHRMCEDMARTRMCMRCCVSVRLCW